MEEAQPKIGLRGNEPLQGADETTTMAEAVLVDRVAEAVAEGELLSGHGPRRRRPHTHGHEGADGTGSIAGDGGLPPSDGASKGAPGSHDHVFGEHVVDTSKWVMLLASSDKKKEHGRSSGNSPLSNLIWSRGRIDRDDAREIADMIRKDPPRLTSLTVQSPGLDGDSLKVICDALPRNIHLRHLNIRSHEVLPDSLDGAAGPSSPLTSLYVVSADPYSREGVTGLAARLRTNTHLTELSLTTDSRPGRAPTSLMDAEEVVRSLVDALGPCNFTLRSLTATDPQGRARSNDGAVTRFLARNARITRVLEMLEVRAAAAESRDGRRNRQSSGSPTTSVASMATCTPPSLQGYRAEPAGLWPLAMQMTSGVPTPLYRLLRHGAVKDVSDCVATPRGGKKKCGRPPSDDGADNDEGLDT